VALGCNMKETWDCQGTWTNSLSQRCGYHGARHHQPSF
jgi:hypothetical protein